LYSKGKKLEFIFGRSERPIGFGGKNLVDLAPLLLGELAFLMTRVGNKAT